MKWQLIENRIIKDNQLKVTNDEVTDYVKELVRNNFRKYGQDVSDDILDKSVKEILSKEDEVKRVYDNMYGKKVMDLFKSKFTLDKKEMTQEEFYKTN